jgi:hypothetical protein
MAQSWAVTTEHSDFKQLMAQVKLCRIDVGKFTLCLRLLVELDTAAGYGRTDNCGQETGIISAEKDIAPAFNPQRSRCAVDPKSGATQ